MKSLIIILAGLYGSWYYTDLKSQNTFSAVVAPIGIFVFLVSLAIWLVAKAGMGARTSNADSSFGDGDGGGDC